jgi:membrane-bound metal-dependent hydrolase YbcI (DUF457 family)
MKDLTHICIGAACGVVATGFDCAPDAVGWAALLIGSTLPDLDHKRSFIGKYVPWISSYLERKFGHRTLTHSLLGVLIFSLIISPSLLFSSSLFSWAIVGYVSHVLLDTFNIQGVPLFYPFSRLEFVAFHNRAWRIPYGSTAEMTMLAIVCLCTLALVPLARGGFSPAFHRMVGSPGATIEDFQRWRDTHKVYCIVDGDAPLKREALKGARYRILDALSPMTLLVEDEQGRAFTVGAGPKAAEAEIWAFRVLAEKGDAIASRQWTVDLSGRSIGDLLDLLPKRGHCYCNADLVLSMPISTPPVTGEFNRAQASGSTLTLRSARRSDLVQIRNAVIQNGVTYIRAEFEPNEVEELDKLDHQRKYTRSVSLAKLPDLGAVLVDVGDKVTTGQALVRNATSIERKALNALLADTRAQLVLLDESAAAQEETAAAQLKAQRLEIKGAKKEIEKARWLVERGAKTRSELDLKELELPKLVESEHGTLRILHSQRIETKKQRISLNAAERGAIAELSALERSEWARSPIDGTVTAVRVESVGIDGVDVVLEMVQSLGE